MESILLHSLLLFVLDLSLFLFFQDALNAKFGNTIIFEMYVISFDGCYTNGYDERSSAFCFTVSRKDNEEYGQFHHHVTDNHAFQSMIHPFSNSTIFLHKSLWPIENGLWTGLCLTR